MTYQINYVFQTKQDLNQRVFNMTVEINGSKTLTRHISCECNCKFYGRKCNLDQWWNNDKYWCECKKLDICEKDHLQSCYM